MAVLDLSTAQGFLLDLDGVVYRGDRALPGALQFIADLQECKVPFLFVTNNSTRSPADVVHKLTALGLTVSEDRVLTSALATAAYLAERSPPETLVYVIGETGLHLALAQRGFRVTPDYRVARFVVAGHDTALTWHKLADATLAIRRGAGFIATNPDRTLPTEAGLVPGAGAVLAALEAASGASPTVIGKPEATIFLEALALLGTPAHRTFVIGDRLDTDILGAHNAGLRSIGVLSGVATETDFATSSHPPDLVVRDLAALWNLWRSARS